MVLKNKTLLEILKRELKEETGCICDNIEENRDIISHKLTIITTYQSEYLYARDIIALNKHLKIN